MENLLTNGSFEQNDRTTYANYYTSEDLAYVPLPDIVPGWTFSHSVDLYGPIHNPQEGNQYLDLVGGGPVAATFSIQQTFTTVPGELYALTFFYGNNENLANALATFTASIVGAGGIIWTQDFSHTGDTYYSHNWTEASVWFRADSSSTTLTFVDTSRFPTSYDPTYTVGGSTLDNISIVVVPESGTLAAGLFVGGLAFVSGVRQRRSRA